MFGRVHSLLAAVCVAALFGEALCDDKSIKLGAEAHATWGRLVGTPIDLQPVLLDGSGREWQVNIPTLPQCAETYGEYARVTDDVEPNLRFESQNLLWVYRNGQLTQPAVVYITVYCRLK